MFARWTEFLSPLVHPSAPWTSRPGDLCLVVSLGDLPQMKLNGALLRPPLGAIPLGISPERWLSLERVSPRMWVMLPTVTPGVTALNAMTRVMCPRLHPRM